MQALAATSCAHLDSNYALIDTALKKAQVFDEEHAKHCSCHIELLVCASRSVRQQAHHEQCCQIY